LFNFLNVIGIIAGVVYLLILILGIYICKKNKFIEGIYFFSILIIFQVCSYFIPFYTNKLFDYYLRNSEQIPGGMSIGELLTIYSIIGIVVRTIPFLILVYGLYRRWKIGIKNNS
jgi:hypothetical protein